MGRQTGTIKLIAYGCLIVAFIIAVLVASRYRPEKKELPYTEGRFTFVADVDFAGRNAHIVLDNQTGIKYLYIWQGGTNGGPAVTRLWEK